MKYANGQTVINNVIIVDPNLEFNDNPLFYVFSEYPVYKKLDHRNYLLFNYEFYTDNSGNKYMFITGYNQYKDFIPELLKEKNGKDKNWSFARNVDAFVEGADKNSYSRWLELIS